MNEPHSTDNSPLAQARRRGLSLVEIMVGLTIIAVLAMVFGPKLWFLRNGAQAKAAQIQVQRLRRAVEYLKLDTGRYPSQAEGLIYLVRSPKGRLPNWNGPYFQGGLPRDPWGRHYVYTAPDGGRSTPLISSLGRDGKPGGTGRDADIVSDQPASAGQSPSPGTPADQAGTGPRPAR